MNYEKYIALQNRVEWFYDFHPNFLDNINADHKKTLQDTFLYDTLDEDYPESLREFYNSNIHSNIKLQRKMITAINALYLAAGVKEVIR